jgi:hypothetical protein
MPPPMKWRGKRALSVAEEESAPLRANIVWNRSLVEVMTSYREFLAFFCPF